MPDARLSALDASFLRIETATAHMHVGWAATFAPPEGRPRPSFEELRDHIAGRLGRTPRYRQRLARVPLDLSEPTWVDDPEFDPGRHISCAGSRELAEIVDAVMSVPLARDRPLWEMWLAPELADGSIGLVGKVHHCMVDGIAAVELATLLVDPEPDPPALEAEGWCPQPAPGWFELLLRGARDRVAQSRRLAALPLEIVRSPTRVLGAPGAALGLGRALMRVALPVAPASALNRPSSPLRHLATLRRPLDDLRTIKQRTGTTVNDVVLASCAGGLCRFLRERGDEAVPLKVMVPVNIRDRRAADDLGNRISFMFVELPCDEPDPLRRLANVHAQTALRKAEGDPLETDVALQALAVAPPPVQTLVSQLVASPRTFNLVISNVPGPRVPLWLRGCRLVDAYPIVPLAQSHALSIGMTTVHNDACFGFYADRQTLPDADRLPPLMDAALDELLEATARNRPETAHHPTVQAAAHRDPELVQPTRLA
jgi:diacylglycerol O-acyltransferase